VDIEEIPFGVGTRNDSIGRTKEKRDMLGLRGHLLDCTFIDGDGG
jgi:hypothetical protein